MTNPNKKIQFVVTLSTRAHEILLLDAKRLGILSQGRSALYDLLLLYAEEMNKQSGQTVKLTKTYMKSFRGDREQIWISLPRWAWDTLRERARRRGFLWGKKGSISQLLQDHAAELSKRYSRLAPDELLIP